MAGFTDKLVVDVRLQIYGYLLSFDKPLHRLRRLTSEANNESDHQQIDTSILFVCKKIHYEALDALVQLNKIVITHDDIHPLGFRRPLVEHQLRLKVQRAVVTEPATPCKWTHCPDCGPGIYAFLYTFHELHFPKLRDLSVDMDGIAFAVPTIREQVERSRFCMRFVRVGSFEVTSPSSGSKGIITFEYRDIITIWNYLQNVLDKVAPGETRSWMMWPPVVAKHVPRVSKSLLEYMCTIFLGAYAPWLLPTKLQAVRFPTHMYGVNYSWLEPQQAQYLNEMTLETLTVQFLRGKNKSWA